MKWTDKATKYLKKYWNIDELKDKQYDAINELLSGNDVIALLPTGYGKSMCYLIPPLVTKKIIFIISPLISLMDDQCEKLIKVGIPCATLHSNNKNRSDEILDIINGKIKIVYMSPEYLIKGYGLELAEKIIDNIGFLAIDESHCVSGWGQDFRPEYTNIKMFRDKFPDIPIIAVTATATENVCKDIKNILNLNKPTIIRASFDRPNLFLSILDIPDNPIKKTKGKKKMSNEELVLPYINKYKNDKIIIYINSRNDCEELALQLTQENYKAAPYHAGLSKSNREDIQSQFSSSTVNIIISTIAYGVGIDQLVRCVIIIGCPSSIDEYFQQIGRAGRDQEGSHTVLFFAKNKLFIKRKQITKENNNNLLCKFKINNLNYIQQLVSINTCRRKFILEYYNEICPFFICNNCDNCCSQKLIDMTDLLWTPIMTNQNLSKYLSNYNNTLFIKWKQYIIKNNISKNNISNNLKLFLPSSIIIEHPKSNNNTNTIYDTYSHLLD